MKAQCIHNGMAFIEKSEKAIWCEVGQVHNIDVKRMGGFPKHFKEMEKEPTARKAAPGAPTPENL